MLVSFSDALLLSLRHYLAENSWSLAGTAAQDINLAHSIIISPPGYIYHNYQNQNSFSDVVQHPVAGLIGLHCDAYNIPYVNLKYELMY